MKIAIQIHADGKVSSATLGSFDDVIKQMRILKNLKVVEMVEVDGVWTIKEDRP